MASSDASGRAYDVFVQRFLTGLSGALHLNNGERATGVKRRIGALRDDTTGMSTSRKVLDARMALGADDALYLQSGLGLLWAGDENLDEKHALFPSSLGSASVGDVARNAAASQLARNVDERVLSIIKELTERLPGLVYLLSLPEIADHIKADLTQRRLVGVSASKGVNDASRYRKDSNLWSGNAPTTLARLITTLAAVKASGRHLANMGDEVDGWINRIREDKSREHVEELITVCASLYGLYMRSAENVPGLVSPMEYTTLYTSAAVDAALTRDWSTIDGVLRAYRADRATQPEGTVAVRDGDSVVGGKGARPLTRGGAGGGGEDSPFAVPGLGPSRAPASTGAAVVDEASVLGSVAGSVSTTGNDAVVVSTLREAGDNNNSANRGNWMSRMLSRNQSAEIGAHTDDAGNSAHSDKTTDPEEHSLKQHRVELTDTQQEGTLAPDLARMKNLVLNPVTAMAALSMELTASPLWQSGVRGDDFDTMTNTRRDNVSLHAKYVAPLIDRRLDPKGAEITFEQDALTRTVTRRRVTGNTVVLSLYDGALGSPYRSMPAEVRAWVQDANNATAPVGNFLRTTQRDKPDDERVDGTTADREALRSARDGEWGDVVEANDRGVAASEELMRPFTDFAHKDRRFVAYAMQRGLVCAPGPHQIPQTYSAQEGMVKVDNVLENEQQTLRYTRGICHAAVRMQKEPNKSNNVGGGGGANLRAVVPTLMHSYWTEVRDGFKSENGTFSVVTEANRLRLMASMQSQLDLGLNERDSAERRRSPQAELLTYWHKTLSARSTVAGIAGAPPRLPKTFGGKSQELSDTQCDVLWAPIVAERTQGPPYDPPETEYLRTETSYTTGAVAACAAATYEHLLDAANHRILVVDGIRTAVKACLKLKQLPHMIAFDAQWTKAAEDGNGRVGNTRMQYIMTDEKMTGRASRMVPIYSATGINGTPLFRTILPSYRRTGDNILEPVASAFSGVWQHRPNMLPGGNNRRWNDLQGGGVYGALSNFGAANLLGSRSPTLFEAFGQLAATAQDIAAPQWGLSVPHVPVGLTHVRTLDAQEEEAALTATGEEKRNRRVKYDDSVSPDYLVAPYERQPVEPYRAHPPWLDSDYKIQKLIRECFELSSQLRELMLQSDAFKAALTDDARAAATGTTSLVERERRGAVWEDALREMAISSDRMYNFLRTMAGTLHEDVQSVVEVEDHAMEASNRQMRERRQEILRQSAQFQSRLIERVMQGVLKDSKLSIDINSDPDALGRAAASELVVVNKEAVERVRELAQGSSGMPFFTQNVELERALGNGSKPMRINALISTLQSLAENVRDTMMQGLDEQALDGARSTLEYLSKPRNSYLVRLKPEAFAAIKSAYTVFTTEWRIKYGMMYRRPSAWELVEGVDMNLTTAFAEFAAHKMAHSRLFGSSHAGYLGVTPARANATQLTVSLHRLISRAVEYVQLVPAPDYNAGAQAYSAQMPREFAVSHHPHDGASAYTAMVGSRTFQRGRRWGMNLYGSA